MQKLIFRLRKWAIELWHSYKRYWHASRLHKAVVVSAAVILLCIGTFYAMSQWYVMTQRGKPYQLGVSFIPSYATSLGLNPQATMDALIQDIGVRRFRLVSYWNEVEKTQGSYDFSSLDWQFKKAETAHATVTLSVGLRQPRWPECHVPEWVQGEPDGMWQAQLDAFIATVVERYKNSPALESYQLENEALLKSFGVCTDFDRSRLVREFNLVQRHDPHHPIIMSRSNNLPSLPSGQPRPDIFGFSIYRRVWDATYTHRYIEYPFPSWYYAGLAMLQHVVLHRDSMVHELQMEAWPPNQKSITEISLAEQNKSFNAKRFSDRIGFVKKTGMHTVDLWGGEYWYYRLVKEHDASVWNAAKEAYRQTP